MERYYIVRMMNEGSTEETPHYLNGNGSRYGWTNNKEMAYTYDSLQMAKLLATSFRDRRVHVESTKGEVMTDSSRVTKGEVVG